MDKTTLKPEIVSLVKKLKQYAQATYPSLEAIVFGSQTKGTAKPYSDIDVCLVSPEFSADLYDRQKRHIRKISFGIDDRLEPHLMHPDEYNNRYYTFAREVKKYGVTIYPPPSPSPFQITN